MMRKLKVLVTGSAQGVGAAVCLLFEGHGHSVVQADITNKDSMHLDVTDTKEAAEFVKRWGPFDVLINSAGITGPSTSLEDTTDIDWHRVQMINAFGTFNMMRVVIPDMIAKGWGRVVNVASIAGKEGNPYQSAYSASKGAVISLTKSAGKEYATTGVLVNAITPALIDTTLIDKMSEKNRLYSLSKIPMDRIGAVEEIAEMIYWLGSPAMSYSTGAIFDISGGRATY
jgi:3-oxoacyl-[acyl-carrier protein] reductase